MNLSEQLKIVRTCFTGTQVETESNGEGGHRIIIHKFLSIEPCMVDRKTLVKTIKVPGFLACLDHGEDVTELYKGTDFWTAVEEVAMELAVHRVRMLRDRFDPCMVPSARGEPCR
jgi:hypothetical protein